MLRLAEEAFEEYLTGLPALRRRVIADLRRKVRAGGVLDHRRESST